jgi:hypothetical protein
MKQMSLPRGFISRSSVLVIFFAACSLANCFSSLELNAQPAKEPNSSAKIASSADTLSTFLHRKIIGPDLSQAEVQRFLESRVPRMPNIRTVSEWQATADRLRARVLDEIVFRGEQARLWRDAKTRVEWLDTTEGGPGYRLRKLRYEALPGMWIPALLYEPDKLTGKTPAALNVNGHDPNGKAAPYKQIRSINQAKRGMLVLNVEWFGMGQLRGEMSEHYRMNQLDLCGISGLAPFYLAMSRGLDLLLSLEHTDPERVAVSGLSGGGWQTIFISSLDTRVKLSNPVAGYSSFLTRIWNLSDLGDSEQTPNDLATVADYSHLTAMLAPRPALLTYNAKDDCCFASAHALPPLLNAARPIYQLFGKESNLRSHVNYEPGTHNFEQDNREQHYRMLGDHFFGGSTEFSWREIQSTNEVKTKEQLNVELPADNANFHSLALEAVKSLPRDAGLPGDLAAAKRWQESRRQILHQRVRTKNYGVQGETIAKEEKDGIKATFWKLKVSGIWTVPAIELVKGEPKATTILVSDGGRTNALQQIERILSLSNRVLVVDPFYFGESKIKNRDFLFALTVAAVGERPLGIQASQLTAIARWSQGEFQTGPAAIVAVGPRSSLFSLVAAAAEERAIDGVELHEGLGSLKEIIEQNWTVNQRPELFCFGLLESFDVKQLVALAAPTPVVFPTAHDRVKMELAGLKDWYKLFGVDLDLW